MKTTLASRLALVFTCFLLAFAFLIPTLLLAQETSPAKSTDTSTSDKLQQAEAEFQTASEAASTAKEGRDEAAASWAIEHYGWLSLLPPLAAIVLAVVTRRVLISLLIGVCLGAAIRAEYVPWDSLVQAFEVYLWGALQDSTHLRIMAFTLLMGAMVGVATRAGGMHGLVELLLPLAKSRRGGQLVGWVLGLLVFFDDYANTVVLGNTLRPMADRLRLSRAKLAYLVDSTSAPVAGVAIISTWIAVELDYIAQGLKQAQLATGSNMDLAYELFWQSIPYRFYVIWALITVPLVALLKRDLGPMLAAERRAWNNPEVESDSSMLDEAFTLPPEHTPRRWWNAVLPVLSVVAIFCGWLFVCSRLETEPDTTQALFYSALTGLVVALLLARFQKLLTPVDVVRAALAGGQTMLPGLCVLWLAWALAGVTASGELNTGGYIAYLMRPESQSWLSHLLTWLPQSLPALVFLLAAIVSFSTGSSWATMAILVPLSIEAAAQLPGVGPGSAALVHPWLLCTVGSVLAGSIFGDHCSPISDTTVLSSQASGCPHLLHVETQLPYALLGGILSIFASLLVGFGLSVWLVLPLGTLSLIAWLWFRGENAEEPAS